MAHRHPSICAWTPVGSGSVFCCDDGWRVTGFVSRGHPAVAYVVAIEILGGLAVYVCCAPAMQGGPPSCVDVLSHQCLCYYMQHMDLGSVVWGCPALSAASGRALNLDFTAMPSGAPPDATPSLWPSACNRSRRWRAHWCSAFRSIAATAVANGNFKYPGCSTDGSSFGKDS